MNSVEREKIVKKLDQFQDIFDHILETMNDSVDKLYELRDDITHPDSEKHLRCPNCDSTSYDVENKKCGVCVHCDTCQGTGVSLGANCPHCNATGEDDRDR